MTSKKTLKIAIASGKGGVGKSMLSSVLAMLFSQKVDNLVAIDCDVDAPNLAVWLGDDSQPEKTVKLETSSKAFVDKAKCTGCGTCEQKCVFKAVQVKQGKAEVSPFTCEGCGRCVVNCPVNAISIKPVENGCIEFRKTKYGFDLVSGQLYPGETGSGKIIDAVKEASLKSSLDMAIVDSSPGTGCPVTAALRDNDYIVLVTEPSPSGFADLKRVLEVVAHFRMEYGIVINKWDVNKSLSAKIEDWCGAEKFLGKISYDKRIIESVSAFKPILETNLPARKEIENIFEKISKKVKITTNDS